nr:hypothetical protein BaRGS_009205 [Batillaria attramentaria]
MGMVIIALYVICFFGVGFYSFRWVPGTCADPMTNLTHDCIQLSEFSVQNQGLFNALTEITFMTVIPLTTLVGVTTTNVIIAVRMRSVLAWRKDTAHRNVNR